MSPPHKDALIHAGELVDLYEGGSLLAGVVVGEEKGRLRIVLENGQELRAASSRVAHRAGIAGTSRPSESAARHAAAAAARVTEIDLPALWDVLVDEPRRHPLGSLADLALGEDSPVARSAMLRCLHDDRTYFLRKGDDHEPRPREQVIEIHKREASEAARARRREAFVTLARAALRGDPAALPGPDDAERVADLVELSLVGEEASAWRETAAIMDEAGVPDGLPAERAFRLLVALGVFREDENLFIHRFHLRTSFPDNVMRAAEEAFRRPVEGGRADLRDLVAFTIDDEQTSEMDDALSLQRVEGLLQVGIHIADPGTFVQAGDPLDQEALARAATYYFPEVRLPMLPPVLGEGAASLRPREDRPALSFLVTLSPLGEVVRHEIVSSTIRSRSRLTYDQADLLLDGDAVIPDLAEQDAIRDALRVLRPVCESLEAERVASGAVVIRAAEVDIKVTPEGEIRIQRIDERGASRRMVSEMMILANRLAAGFLQQRGVPAIYRRQAPPSEPEPSAPPEVEARGYDPVAVRRLRRRMRRGETSLQPGPHAGLGLAAYTQATSPIRRYQDLAVHRQIKAALLGQELPYGAEDLARIAATTEEAERAAREAERGTDEYWILRHYEQRIGGVVDGVIVSVDPRRTEVELEDTLHNVTLPARPDHRPGQRVRLTIEAVRPRARRLVLREAAL
ncbi:MAG: RNB domain-containing ribonuclease [Candidatus Polarisedimenticolia bacterium]